MNFSILISMLMLLICIHARSNVIMILTDDQDVKLNSMIAMPNVKNFIANKGVRFENSFVNSPICCPSRSTLLTGKYLHNTYVFNNSLSGNCSSVDWQNNYEHSTFPALLKSLKNYTTFYAGKYLNQYGSKECGGTDHIPLGYDWWIGLKGNSRYYNYTLSINGTAKTFTDEYLTDVMKDYALSFLNQKLVRDGPFLMILATPAPHAPFTPAPANENLFPNVKTIKTPSFNYSSSDKHWLIRMPPKFLPTNVTILDDIQRHRLQTLVSVDEMVKEVVTKLSEIEVLNNTYIIFASDNGYHIGQFVQPWDKRQPYETDIRIPFLIRGPNLKQNYTTPFPISFIDVAPTVLDIADIKINLDGESILPHISINSRESNEIDKRILIEYHGEGCQSKIDKSCPWVYDENLTECTAESWCKCQDAKNNTFACVRHLFKDKNFKFCQFYDDDNFVEAYDLNSDPFELINIHSKLDLETLNDYQRILNNLLNCKNEDCKLR